MDIVVIDVETANRQHSSICQVGIARFLAGQLVEHQVKLVDPELPFESFNTHLHGIGPEDVVNAPTWPELQGWLRPFMAQGIIASHTYFDRTAMESANRRYGLTSIRVAGWVDTCRLARLAWPHLTNHKLTSLAREFGISYQAHDAQEDARCAGEVLWLAAKCSVAVWEHLGAAAQGEAPKATRPRKPRPKI